MTAAAQTAEEASRHLRNAVAHLESGEVDRSVRECKAALALDPHSAAAHMLLGKAYLALRSVTMIGEAKAELQEALNLDPYLLWARLYLATRISTRASTTRRRMSSNVAWQNG